MRVVILRFPGTNCEFDTQYAFEKLGHTTELIWHKEESLPEYTDLVVVPGGFSYGDYLRSGSIARFSTVMKAVKEYANSGGRVLGICNGFQILTEAGLLPGALKRNNNLHFISKIQHLKVVNSDNAFLNRCSDEEILKSTTNIASADKDKVDVNELATLIKGKMSKHPDAELPVNKDDIYIDKDGRIHYPAEK